MTDPPRPAPVDLPELLALRLRTGRLELRLPLESELRRLAQVAVDGVHGDDEMPFLVPWTDHVRAPGFTEDFVDYHLGLRRHWSVDEWQLELGVWVGGELLGVQALNATRFTAERTVRSGSWLGRRFHGRGFGTEMRAAVLELAFRGLGAREARTGAFDGNAASAAVSAKLGYDEVGERIVEVRGEPVRERLFALQRARWARGQRAPVEIEGLERCRARFVSG